MAWIKCDFERLSEATRKSKLSLGWHSLRSSGVPVRRASPRHSIFLVYSPIPCFVDFLLSLRFARECGKCQGRFPGEISGGERMEPTNSVPFDHSRVVPVSPSLHWKSNSTWLTNYGRLAPGPFRRKSIRSNSNSFRPNSKSFPPNQKLVCPQKNFIRLVDFNKRSTLRPFFILLTTLSLNTMHM